MNITQILEVLPPLVYIRRGELVIQFAAPTDLVGRVAELSSVLTALDQESNRTDPRGRGRQVGRIAGSGVGRGQIEPEPGTIGDTGIDRAAEVRGQTD